MGTDLRQYGGKRMCGNAETLVLASDSVVLVMFVTPHGEGTARNVSKME
jgi:hypothetical protein